MILNPMLPLIVVGIVEIIVLALIYLKTKTIPVIEIVIMLLILTIDARPMISSGISKVLTTNLDVIIVVDNTVSMNAEDYQGGNTRISGVKKDVEIITEELSGSRFAILAFDNTAKIKVPFTYDTNMAQEAVEVLKPLSTNVSNGSSLNIPYKELENLVNLSSRDNDRITYVIFMSDGEITDKSTLQSFEKLKSKIDGGAVLGYGTKMGGRMQEESIFGSYKSYVRDKRTGKDAISVLDEDNLKKLSSDLGVGYYHIENEPDMRTLAKSMKETAKKGLQKDNISSYKDIYFIFVIPLLIILYLYLFKLKEETI